MGHALAFDTLAYSKRLKEAGVPDKQAEVQAETFAEIIDERLSTKHDLKELEVVLKRDIKELETSLKRDMKELETSLKRDIKELETSLRGDMKEIETGLRGDMKEMEMRLTIRLGVMLTAGIAIIATLVKLL